MRLHDENMAPVLAKRIIYLGLLDEMTELSHIRGLCWDLGAFTSICSDDPGITHVVIPETYVNPEIVVGSSSESNPPLCVGLGWLIRCHELNAAIDEFQFMVKTAVIKRTPLQANVSKLISQPSASLSYRPSDTGGSWQGKPVRERNTHRRSDVSSVALHPHGIFRGLRFSLLGWTNPSKEAVLCNQIVASGGSIVEFTCKSQYACLCAHGARPSHQNTIRLVSEEWINDCLADHALLDPKEKVIYSPSLGQIPLLMVNHVCLYITEKDPLKFANMSEIAKLCNIRCMSRDNVAARLSAVTHCVFHDLASVSRRRDLVLRANKANKFVVSFEWLKDTFLQGSIQDESKYDLSSAISVPALSNVSSTQAPAVLAEEILVIPEADSSARMLAQSLGASTSGLVGHSCSIRIVSSSNPDFPCNCLLVSEQWLRECHQQKRLVSRESFLLATSPTGDTESKIVWQNKNVAKLVDDTQ